MMRITSLAAGTMVSLTALALAACGSSGTDSAARSNADKGRPATIEVASNGRLGPILDADGRTLYVFAKDSGTKSACSAECATVWPPLRAGGKPTVGAGASASSVRTTPRSGGGRQVTYDGHPLYTYTGDQNPGDTNGQGLTEFGGLWAALTPAGEQVSGTGTNAGATGY